MSTVHSGPAVSLQSIDEFVASLPGVPDVVARKYHNLADPVRGPRLRRLLEYELALASFDVEGRVVLDAGCGAGTFTLLFALAGAARVVALDLFPANVETLARVAAEFGLPIDARHADVACSGLDAHSVDLAYCVEAISHFNPWEAALDEFVRVLAPRGTVFVGDGNNGANPTVRRRILDFWQQTERGPFTTERTYTGHYLPYVFRRWMLIRSHFPQASDEQVFQLGLHTSHLGGQPLLDACRLYLEGGELPGPAYARGQSIVRPEDEQHNEEPVHPRDIVRRLRAQGLEAHAYAHLGLNRHPLLKHANRAVVALGSLPLMLSERYIVVGHAR